MVETFPGLGRCSKIPDSNAATGRIYLEGLVLYMNIYVLLLLEGLRSPLDKQLRIVDKLADRIGQSSGSI